MKPTLKMAERLVREQKTWESRQAKAREALLVTVREKDLWMEGAKIIERLVKNRKTPLNPAVIFKYLELHGFHEQEARSALWDGLGKGMYCFDKDYNVIRFDP